MDIIETKTWNLTDRLIQSLKPKDKAYEISAGSRSGLRLKSQSHRHKNLDFPVSIKREAKPGDIRSIWRCFTG